MQKNSDNFSGSESEREFLQEQKRKKNRKEKIIAFVSIFVAIAFIVAFISINAVLVKTQTLALTSKTIDSQKIVTQQSQNIAGKATHWTKIIPIAEITKDKDLVKLPKNATNIVVKAVAVVPLTPKLAITNQDRAKLVALVKQIKPNQNLLASLSASVWNFFTADLSDIADSLIQTVSPSTDATVVDVSVADTISSTTPQDVVVTYDTPAPEITSQTTNTKKLVTVSNPNEDLSNPDINVLAFSNIPEIFKVGQENNIRVRWKNHNNESVAFKAYDLNGNGKLDYIEWTVPHLSNQTFEIDISGVLQLDEDLNTLADVTSQTQTQDGIYASFTDSQTARVTFASSLSSTGDLEIYASSTDQPTTIDVYPVYTDGDNNQTEGSLVATFPTIGSAATYKVSLTGLSTETNVFDLKITNDVDIDYILDLTPICPGSMTGSGVLGDECLVKNWADLNGVRKNLTLYYKLDANLCSPSNPNSESGANTCVSVGYNGIGNNWVPIGDCGVDDTCGINWSTDDNSFSGNFNGNNSTISNLIANGSFGVGLFGIITGNIHNIGLIDASITGDENVGGLVGYNDGGTISYSFSTGNVTGSSSVGGLVGLHYSGSTSNCYSTASVSGSDYVGGLAGTFSGTLSNSYSSGSVSGSNYYGGLIGTNDGTISKSYWDVENSGQPTSPGGTGMTSAQMKAIATFNLWDIGDGVTDFNGGYPYLSWQDGNNTNVWSIYISPTPPASVLSSIKITPADSIMNVCQVNSTTFTAEGFDQYGNSLGDVTSTAVFTLDGSVSDWDGSIYKGSEIGTHTVIGAVGSITDRTLLIISGNCGGGGGLVIYSHTECGAQEKCVSVDGYGKNQCVTNNDCVTHNICNSQSQCVSVTGAGTDKCKVNSDCVVVPLSTTPPSETTNEANEGDEGGGTAVNTPAGQLQSGSITQAEITMPTAEKAQSATIVETFTTAVVAQIPESVKTAAAETKKVIESPQGSAVTKTVSTIGFVATAAAASSSIPFSFLEIFLFPLKFFGLILTGLGLKKRVMPWGAVYDSVTKQPIDPAYVILKDTNGKKISSAITDIDGRYGFLVGPGIYQIEVHKSNYTFPSQKLNGKMQDELYSDIYLGGNIEVKKQGEIIAKNIPLDSVKFDWNEFAKKNRSLTKFHYAWGVIQKEFFDIFFVIGFIVAIVAYIFAPHPYNAIVVVLYLILLLFRIFGLKLKSYGYISDGATGNPLSFAIMRVMMPGTNMEIGHRVADQYGRYYCLVPKGRYYVEIEKKNDDGSYSMAYTSPAINVSRKGIIKERFEI